MNKQSGMHASRTAKQRSPVRVVTRRGFIVAAMTSALLLAARGTAAPNELLASEAATPIAETTPDPSPAPLTATATQTAAPDLPAESTAGSSSATPEPTPTSEAAIVVVALDDHIAITLGGTAAVRYRVSNASDRDAQVQLTVEGGRDDWLIGPVLLDDGSPASERLVLAAGQSLIVIVRITVPASAYIDERATVQVRARALANG